ncbi:MAG: translocation and assembly module TamB [Chthoniobacter sp.]|nr:translocation and assembly module TamB [Chthoniobacter sp.]
MLLIIVAIASLFEPHCFRFAVAQSLRIEAWRCGIHTQVQAVEGSFFEPVTLRNSVWIYESDSGPIMRLEIKQARADLSWRNLFSRGSAPWFRELAVDGVIGKIQLPIEAPASAPPPRWKLPRPHGQWLPGPERIEASNVDFMFESDGDYVRLQNAGFTVSEVAPGEIKVAQLIIKQPWLNRTFRDVRATTKLEDSRTELAGVTLDPEVQIQSLSVELQELARGQLNLEMQVAAFGGAIRIETQTIPWERQLVFEATSTFSQIAIGKLATFLGQSDAAGGTIKEGKFTFRGSPQSPMRATASLRLEATNFQWESRQWDSLVLGATLMEGRVQIPELTLHQGHNHLRLNGELTLPAAEQAWWQKEFAFDINAQIDNLTELSALMLPEFKYAAGKGTIDGSVRGKNQQFTGQIIVSGSDVTWHNAPIDELHATLKLNGNELQLSNLSIFNDGDFVRGRGVVNILGDKQYWGELRASIDDLGKYAALLQKPIVPEPLAGGAMIDWVGEGSAKGHTGKVLARLRKVRSLGASAALLHPINADLEGSYQPGVVLFSRFALWDDASSFTANVSVGNKALTLQGIRFFQGDTLQLEGDALLPLDVWQAWPNTSLSTMWNDSTVSRVRLHASDFDLHAASQLTGWNFPIAGRVGGELTADGPLGSIQSSGRLALHGARVPLGWTGLLLNDVEGEATFAGQTLAISKFAGRHPAGDFRLTGEVDFTNLRDPALKLSVLSDSTVWDLFRVGPVEVAPVLAGARTITIGDGGGVSVTAALALEITGPGSSARVAGKASVRALALETQPDLTPVLLGRDPAALTQIFKIPAAPWSGWTFAVAGSTAGPLRVGAPAGTLVAEVWLTGTGLDPVLEGTARFEGLAAQVAQTSMRIEEAILDFRADAPRDPALSLKASGVVLGEPFQFHAAGPLSHLLRFIVCAPPLTDAVVRAQLTSVPADANPALTLLVPVALAGGIEVFAWAPIATPPAAPGGASPAEGPQ